MQSDTEKVAEYWNRRARSEKPGCEMVDASLRAQRMRFETFLHYHDVRGKRILDLGCGVGDLFEHLRIRGIDCDYLGVDVSRGMIDHCRNRFPGKKFEQGDILENDFGGDFDYVVAFAIHNVRVGDYRSLLKRVTQRQFDLSRIAAHLSILTDRYQGFAAHIQSWRAEEVLTIALEITPYVVLRHDYLPNDFSVTLYREPLVDTCKDLLLD